MYCKRTIAVLCSLTSFLIGCKPGAPESRTARQRTAILRFENLSGDNAEDWQGRALSELLKQSFHAQGMPRAASPAPGISTERLAANDSGATRLIYGYYTSQSGVMTVTAFSEDLNTQRIQVYGTVSGSIHAVAEEIAKQLGGTTASSSKLSLNALREFAMASDTNGADAIPHYDKTIQSDPDFGPAYLGLSRAAIAAKDAARAQAVLNQGLARAANFSAQDRADLQLESATLRGDRSARVLALESELALSDRNPDTLRILAEAELSSRKPEAAEKHFGELAKLSPEDANTRNLLAYASIAARDEAGARAAALDYKRLRPQDPNAFDTQGDVELAFSHFAAAEKAYLAGPDPAFQDYSPSWKAANARLLSGDSVGATSLFERHRQALVKAGSPAATYRAAEWLFRTGHRAEAISAMAKVGSESRLPDLRAAAYTQAAIWAVLLHDNAQAVQYSDLALHPARNPTFVFAALARFLAQPPASPDEWTRRADLDFKGENSSDLRRLAIGLALANSDSAAAALPVWKQIYERSAVADALPLYLYGWSLLETGHASEALPLLKLNPIPPSVIAPTFEAFYTPAVLEWRKSSLRQ